MNNTTVILFFLFPLWSWAQDGASFSVFQKKHHTLSRELEVDVFFPDNYSNDTPYPIIYFNDGEGLKENGYFPFEEIERAIKKGTLAPFIMVGIYAGSDRTSRYTPFDDPWISANWGAYKPLADRYSTQLIRQLIPYIEQRYTVDTSRRAIVGMSLGGLHAAWIAMNNPRLFSFVGALSPSFWVNDYELIKHPPAPSLKGTRFYFDMGTSEWNYYLPLIRQLEDRGLEYGESLFYYEVPDARHLTEDWKKRLLPIIRLFLSEKPSLTENWEVIIECIPSQSRPGHIFQRINPIVYLEGNIPYSLAYEAEYTLLKGKGTIQEDGSIEVGEKVKLILKVRHRDKSRIINVKKCK